MSTLRATNLKGGSAGSAPNLPDGAVVTGVVTATSFSGSGANLTGIDATALKDGGGTVRVQANTDGAVVTGILTATSFKGDGSQLTGIDALPTMTGTAYGSIAANRAVLLKNDGTYEQVTGVDQGYGTARTFFDEYTVVAGAYNPDLSNFALLYQDKANGYYVTSVVGSISGTTVSFGTPQVLSQQNPGAYCMAMNYDPQYDVYVGFFRYSTYQNRIRIALGTASGTSINWDDSIGNATFSNANNADYYGSCYNPTAQRHALVYRDQNNGGAIKAAELTVTGTTSVSYDQSDNMWSSSGYNNCYICYDSTNDCYLVAATKVNNNNYGNVRLFLSNQLASPPGNQWDLGGYRKIYGIEHDPVSGNTCVLYYNTANGNTFLVSTTSVNRSTGAITGGTDVQVNDGGSGFKGAGMTYDSNAKKFVITYSYSTGGTSARVASVNSAGVISLDPIMTINSTIYSDPDNTVSMINIFNSNVNKVATIYQDVPNMIGSGSYGGWSRAITAGSTNLDAAKYIGFSAESVTNGQTVKVKTKSNTVTQAGLTTSSRYYVQSGDGTVGSTASNPSIDVGIALNSNTVLLQ